MNFAEGPGNPDDRVREFLRKEKAQKSSPEQAYRRRADAAARYGKLDTARYALDGAIRCAKQKEG